MDIFILLGSEKFRFSISTCLSYSIIPPQLTRVPAAPDGWDVKSSVPS